MSLRYTKTVWENNKTTINATKLNNIESGIDNATDAINSNTTSIDTINDILDTNNISSDNIKYNDAGNNNKNSVIYTGEKWHTNSGNNYRIYRKVFTGDTIATSGPGIIISITGTDILPNFQWLISYSGTCGTTGGGQYPFPYISKQNSAGLTYISPGEIRIEANSAWTQSYAYKLIIEYAGLAM